MNASRSAESDSQKPLPITENEVRLAYKLFLGREAESDAVVKSILSSGLTLPELRKRFLSSAEFDAKLPAARPAPLSKPLSWPPISVEVDVSDQDLKRMVSHVEGNWQKLGEGEPHWSVVTKEEYKSANIEQNLEAFYESGKKALSCFLAAAARCGIRLCPNGTCFELGCGVGRVTLALSETFAKVIGCDLSSAHLRIAKEAAAKFGRGNIDYRQIQAIEGLSNLPTFNYFFCVIVLQHNPPPVMKALLLKILSGMDVGGVAYFQVPTYCLKYNFDAQQYLYNAHINGKMEVHVLPQSEVFGILKATGCEVLEIREDNWTGNPKFISNSFLVQKNL